jgi:ATP-dependent exoDNAse (exonuclease V) alpha subunit
LPNHWDADDRIFRQAAESEIVTAAYTINQGRMPNLKAPEGLTDFYLNDYNRGAFNGHLGVIEKINRIEQGMVVNFEGRQVEHDFGDSDELALAYVLSIHGTVTRRKWLRDERRPEWL